MPLVVSVEVPFGFERAAPSISMHSNGNGHFSQQVGFQSWIITKFRFIFSEHQHTIVPGAVLYKPFSVARFILRVLLSPGTKMR
jgi:hypothetical protein